jgi:hypothetical protein
MKSEAEFEVCGQPSQGFTMTFENGWTISVRFGTMNYCENRSWSLDAKDAPTSCPDAEVAVLDPEGKFYAPNPFDDVYGRITPNQVAVLVDVLSKMAIEPATEQWDTYNLDKVLRGWV